MDLRHRYLLRATLGPGVLLVVVGSAYFAIEVYGLQSALELRWLAVVALFACLLMLLLLLRLVNTAGERETVRGRERNLVEQQRAFDRLHSGISGLRRDPGKTRWLQLAEQNRITDAAIIAGWELRYQELLAHPSRKAWATEALKGRFPSDAEIDYELHPHLLLTCIHLQPIESAIRKAGIYCSALSPISIVTFASLHASKARRHYSLPSFIEWETTGVSATNPDTSALVCRQCGSRIQSGAGEPFPP